MAATAAVEDLSRNRPLDDAETWLRIDWATVERDVRRLRQRIFKAAKDGNLAKVRNLQKLMLSSHSNTLQSVRRVTQSSSGRKTAGMDGEVVLTPTDRGRLARQLAGSNPHARPVTRVYIPKPNGRKRPLGIPVIRDRVHQARVKNALEPEWEARFEGRSYGFRPGRGCQDAMQAIHNVIAKRSVRRGWVLDADLSAAFDRIDHGYLMRSIGAFPARDAIRGWLKAGVMDRGHFAPTEEGTPQGGVISPLLLNIALHGMEKAAGVKLWTQTRGGNVMPRAAPKSPILIRYADDFVVMCLSEEQARHVQQKLADWLRPRGLSLNEKKTQVVHLTQGFDFLGFTFKKHRNGRVLAQPSQEAVKRLKCRLKEITRRYRGAPVKAMIAQLNPLIRGWSTYYRHVAASITFNKLDAYMFQLLWRWAVRQHARKGRRWVKQHYWGQHHAGRSDRWIFGSQGSHVQKFSWTHIVRHTMVRGGASKDDPDLADYWDQRTRRRRLPQAAGKIILSLAARQKGRCPRCGLDLIEGAEFQPDDVKDWVRWFSASARSLDVHHVVHRRTGSSHELKDLELRHAACHRLSHSGDNWRPHGGPRGPLEPDAV